MSRITLVLALMASFLVCAECSERGTSSESPSLAKGISAQERRALVALYEPQKETQTIGAIAHRHCRLIWLILHQGVRLRRTWSGCQPEVEASPHYQGDPPAPNLRLSDRTTEPSSPQSTAGAAIFEPGGGAGSGSGLSTANHCRSRCHGGNFSFEEMSVLVGWCLPGRRRQRRRKLQPPLSEGQPPHAARSQSDGQRRSQDQRKHLRDCVSPLGPAPGT
jgi:hypothetical protein